MKWKYSGLICTHQQMTTGDMDRIRSVTMGKQHLIELIIVVVIYDYHINNKPLRGLRVTLLSHSKNKTSSYSSFGCKFTHYSK